MPRTLSLLAVLKKVDAKGVKSLSNAQWDTFLASDTEPNEIQDKIKKLEGYENTGAGYDKTGDLIPEDNNAMIARFRARTGRGVGRESLKVKKSKVNIGEFLGRDKESQKLLTGTVDKSQNPPIDFNQKDVKKKNKKLVTDGNLEETVNLIAEKVTSIETTLKEQKKLNDENVKLQKQRAENLKRENEKGRLGQVTGFLKGAADKIIAPVQGIFGKLFGFIKRLILGKILLNILKWFGNPTNAGKIDSVIKFFGNNWQKLLALYLVFGTGLGRFVRFLTRVAIKGVIKLAALVAQLAFAKGVGGAGKWSKFLKGRKGKLLATVLQVGTATAMTMGISNSLGGDKEEPQKFNKGGKVRGQGDKDTVPAMLTPGEFVMSKGAVQQYGVNTLEGMNAAAGGTNVPVLMSNKKRRGYNGGGRVVTEDENTISKEDKEWILSEVNKERALSGNIVAGDPLAPLKADAIKYSKDASIIKGKGKEHYFGPEKDEKIETRTNIDTMVRTVVVTVDGETTNKTYKLTNEQASAWLKKQGIPAMELADGTIVGDTAAQAYDKAIAALTSMRALAAEQKPEALAAFNALPDVIAMDKAIADGSLRKEIITNSRKHKRGTKENLMQKNMNMIAEIDGDQTVELKEHMFANNIITETKTDRVKYGGGGLVLGYNNGARVYSQEEANAIANDWDNRPEARITKLRNEQDQIRPGPNGKFSKKDSDRMYEIIVEIKKIEREIRGDITTQTETPVNKKKRSGGGFKRMVGGIADHMTYNMFDFDKKSGGGNIRKTANAVGGAAKGIGSGIKRGVGGFADAMTGNLFDFDNRSGGGLLRKTANAIGGLFGKGKSVDDKGKALSSDKVMGKEPKEPKIEEINVPAENLESILIKISRNQDIKTPVGQPSLSGPKITVLPENKSINTTSGSEGGGTQIPKFNLGYGSPRKMKQLGISR